MYNSPKAQKIFSDKFLDRQVEVKEDDNAFLFVLVVHVMVLCDVFNKNSNNSKVGPVQNSSDHRKSYKKGIHFEALNLAISNYP